MKKYKLFIKFPYIECNEIILRKIEAVNLEDLYEIYSNENLYKYKPGSAKKSIEVVRHIINHFERDFIKKKTIFLGIFYKEDFNKLIGVVEIFDVDKKVSMATIGYTLNESYCGNGIATNAVKLLINFLFNEIDINRIQAYGMIENIKSINVLERSGFTKEGTIRQGTIWTGKGIVDLDMYSILKKEYS
ncbi:GNAT family protein [Clostridium sp.]|uniref:GNAT family N-acetyltransferase n=1 Tax=Clostridium sp. TaxID=1506 RepID=UPI0025C4F6D5|nr:GNAT family protein [Clostridium sp.]